MEYVLQWRGNKLISKKAVFRIDRVYIHDSKCIYFSLQLTLALFATLAYAHAEAEADAAPEADALFWGRRRYYGYSRPYYGHGYFRGNNMERCVKKYYISNI